MHARLTPVHAGTVIAAVFALALAVQVVPLGADADRRDAAAPTAAPSVAATARDGDDAGPPTRAGDLGTAAALPVLEPAPPRRRASPARKSRARRPVPASNEPKRSQASPARPTSGSRAPARRSSPPRNQTQPRPTAPAAPSRPRPAPRPTPPASEPFDDAGAPDAPPGGGG